VAHQGDPKCLWRTPVLKLVYAALITASIEWRCAGSPEPGAEWRDAVAQLAELQNQYQAWLDSLPPSLAHSPTADALRAICDLDLTLLEIEPPRGYGRD
jgi:hypothetical protein